MFYSKSIISDMETSLSIGNGKFGFQNPCDLLKSDLTSSLSMCNTTLLLHQTSQLVKATTAVNGNSEIDLTKSVQLGLSFYNSNNTKISINSLIDIWIPRNTSISFRLMSTRKNFLTNGNQLLPFGFNLTQLNNSVFLDLMPSNNSTAYLLAVKNGGFPFINTTNQSYDEFKIFCSLNLSSSGFYFYFSTILNSNFIGFGLRELTTSENLTYCSDQQPLNEPPVLNATTSFGENDFLYRFYTTGCYYLDKSTGIWKSDGLAVQSDTNLTFTHCISSHLTDFASSESASFEAAMPPSIDFNYAFANAAIEKNSTIYLTLIIVISIYLIACAWCIRMDKRDSIKTKLYLLRDNDPFNLYYYEMIVFTGNRKDAGTESKVNKLFSILCV